MHKPCSTYNAIHAKDFYVRSSTDSILRAAVKNLTKVFKIVTTIY